MTTPTPDPAFESAAIVELLGHRRYVAHVREIELAGAKLLRLDIPLPGGHIHPYFVGAGGIYAITPIAIDDVTDGHRRHNEEALAGAQLLTGEARARYDARKEAEAAAYRARYSLPEPEYEESAEPELDDEDMDDGDDNSQ